MINQVSSKKVDITVEFIYILFMNSLIVEVILCGGYDTLMNKFRNIKGVLNQGEEDITSINNDTNINNKGITSNNEAESSKTTYTESK